MGCNGMDLWTFSDLVGAFLDLSIAYFLLCASSSVFFASKLLDLFGLSLPCPCDGLFVNPNRSYCIKKVLVDMPIEKASGVQMYVRSKPPFDSVLSKDQNLDLSMKVDGDGDCCGNEFVGLEGEASCSSILDVKGSRNVVDIESKRRNENGGEFQVTSLEGFKDRKVDVKGKGITLHKPKIGIPRRRKRVCEHGLGANHFPDDMEVYNVNDVDLYESIHENNGEEKISSLDVELESDAREALVDGDYINTISVLEQALDEEHSARASLYVELEKERNAAATAADETMAMILRLQEEKAFIEMQARQYQRMIEEKSAYDAEEMSILKEILLRREREILYLEKEFEAYRQMINPVYDQLEEDSDLMLSELSETTEKNEMVKTKEVTFVDMKKHSIIQFGVQEREKDADLLGQHNLGMQSSANCIDDVNHKRTQQLESYKLRSSQEHHFLEKTIPIVGVEQEENGSANLYTVKNDKYLERLQNEISPGSEVLSQLAFGKELPVHDVHVIDRSKGYNVVMYRKDELLSETDSADAVTDCSRTSSLDRVTNTKRRSLDLATRLPRSSTRGKFVVSDMRRSSMSALDTERLKIDIEVEWLREKLKTVQEGREKLSVPAERQETEKLQLQLLEDIVRQLREIRQLREPVCQASLPPPSSNKVMPNKRSYRTVSLNQSS